MKILHIHTSLKSGGIEAMVSALASEMVNRNDVTFCSIFEIHDNDVFLKKIDKRVKIYSLHKKSAGIQLMILWKIYSFIKKGNFDIVQIHGFFYYYFFAILFLHSKCRFFYTVHNDANQENTKWDRKIFFIKRLFFKWNWVIPITISDNSKRSFVNLYHMNAALIYNGTKKKTDIKAIDLNKYRYTENTRILLNPARICLQKNQLMLCKVCSQLIKDGFDLVLLIAGSKQDTKIFSKIYPYLNERIIYLGERNDIINIMVSSDAFCLSSSWEGMPVTLLEALSVGCIPICTPVGGIPNVVDNSTSFLSESTETEDYYNILKDFLCTNKMMLSEMKKNCKILFEKYDIKNTALSYEHLYKENLK